MPRSKRLNKPPLSIAQIRRWARAYFQKHGRWPVHSSGPVAGAGDLNWNRVSTALAHGFRGLPQKRSLGALLDELFPAARKSARPSVLTYARILHWADEHRLLTGRWPHRGSGEVLTEASESWGAICIALKQGHRGLRNKTTLARLLHKYRGAPLSGRAIGGRPPLTQARILDWARKHHERTGAWPRSKDGPVQDDPRERWSAINAALVGGIRGLPGGSSLKRLLVEKLGAPERKIVAAPLTIEQIMTWAEEHLDRTGDWPTSDSGAIPRSGGETWVRVNSALRLGGRGLPTGHTLATLLLAQCGRLPGSKKPSLSIEQILQWADRHHEATGRWPTSHSGRIQGADEDWLNINAALRTRGRGLWGCPKSLALLLARHRGQPYRKRRQVFGPRPPLNIDTILEWARAYHKRKGCWPTRYSGKIAETDDDTWSAVNQALMHGNRGLAGGATLTELLDAHVPASERPHRHRPNLTHEQILAWAREYHRENRVWPAVSSGPIPDSNGETWSTVHHAMNRGRRGLRSAMTLNELLRIHVGDAKGLAKPPLTKTQIIEWARAHHRQTGKWPTVLVKDVIEGSDGTTWPAIDIALKLGYRGLERGSSLSKLLRPIKGKFPGLKKPRLTHALILKWADEHRARTGRWPVASSGRVESSPEPLNWTAVDTALFVGMRGLERGWSLARLLKAHRGVALFKPGSGGHDRAKTNREPKHTEGPPLALANIRLWARAHYRRFGRWPRPTDGAIPDAPGESWAGVNSALEDGGRGLPGGSSLLKLTSRLDKPANLATL